MCTRAARSRPRPDLGVKIDHRPRAERDENQEHYDLGDDERRLFLRGRQRVQRGKLHERLRDGGENIEIKRGDRADDINQRQFPLRPKPQ